MKALLLVIFFIVVVDYGLDASYVRSESSVGLRLFFVFPILVFIFCFVNARGGRLEFGLSALRTGAARLSGVIQCGERKAVILALICAAGASGLISWVSIAFPAVVVELFASQSYYEIDKVVAIASQPRRKGYAYYDVTVFSINHNESIKFYYRDVSDKISSINIGDTICVMGRSLGVFGAVVDDFSVDTSKCPAY